MNTKILSKREFGNSVQTTIQIGKNDKSQISLDEVSQIINRFKSGGAKILVRALNVERWSTRKKRCGRSRVGDSVHTGASACAE